MYNQDYINFGIVFYSNDKSYILSDLNLELSSFRNIYFNFYTRIYKNNIKFCTSFFYKDYVLYFNPNLSLQLIINKNIKILMAYSFLEKVFIKIYFKFNNVFINLKKSSNKEKIKIIENTTFEQTANQFVLDKKIYAQNITFLKKDQTLYRIFDSNIISTDDEIKNILQYILYFYICNKNMSKNEFEKCINLNKEDIFKEIDKLTKIKTNYSDINSKYLTKNTSSLNIDINSNSSEQIDALYQIYLDSVEYLNKFSKEIFLIKEYLSRQFNNNKYFFSNLNKIILIKEDMSIEEKIEVENKILSNIFIINKKIEELMILSKNLSNSFDIEDVYVLLNYQESYIANYFLRFFL